MLTGADCLAHLSVRRSILRHSFELSPLHLLFGVPHYAAVFLAVLCDLEHARVAELYGHVELLGDHAGQDAVKVLRVEYSLASVVQGEGEGAVREACLRVVERAVDTGYLSPDGFI